jgi:hypothetical protein
VTPLLLLLLALKPPAVEVGTGIEWHSEDLRIETPGPGRFLPAFDALGVPVELVVRPWVGCEAGILRNLRAEGRWLRTLPQAVPHSGLFAVHERLDGRVGSLLGLGGSTSLGFHGMAVWARTRLGGASVLEPQTLRVGGGASLVYEGVLRFRAGADIGYLAAISGLGRALSEEDGFGVGAEAELSGRAGPVRLGGRLGLSTQRSGPGGAGATWNRIGLGLRLGWEVDRAGTGSEDGI